MPFAKGKRVKKPTATCTDEPRTFWHEAINRRMAWVRANAPLRAGLFEKVYAGKASPRLRIKVFCLDCVGCDTTAIRECCAYACPLHEIRPYQK